MQLARDGISLPRHRNPAYQNLRHRTNVMAMEMAPTHSEIESIKVANRVIRRDLRTCLQLGTRSLRYDNNLGNDVLVETQGEPSKL